MDEDEFNPATFKVNDLSWHELLHGVAIANRTLDLVLGYVAVRAVLHQNPALAAEAEKAQAAVMDLYQAVGAAAPHLGGSGS